MKCCVGGWIYLGQLGEIGMTFCVGFKVNWESKGKILEKEYS